MSANKLMVGLLGLLSIGVYKFWPSSSTTAADLPSLPQSQSKSWATPSAPNSSVPRSLSPSIKKSFKSASLTSSRQGAFDKPYAYFHERLTHLNSCLETQNCAYSQKDPRAYEAAIYQEMLTTLRTLSSWQKRHQYKDPRIPYLMSQFLLFDHPYIKIEALKILGTQDPRPELLDVVLEEVIQYSQPEVIPQGMKQLQQHYRSASNRKKIDQAFTQVLLRGGVFAANEVAENLQPFIHRGNYNHFRQVLTQLEKTPFSQEIVENLRESLQNH